MDKYARVLVIIFFLSLINIGLGIYILSKLNKSEPEKQTQNIVIAKTMAPSATTTTTPNIQSDLSVIKAEIRALRTSLETTGLIVETPTP